MKKFMCKIFNLVEKEKLDDLAKKMSERDSFILEMSENLDPVRCRVLYTGDKVEKINFDGVVYLLGDHISLTESRLGKLIVGPFSKHNYLSNLIFNSR